MYTKLPPNLEITRASQDAQCVRELAISIGFFLLLEINHTHSLISEHKTSKSPTTQSTNRNSRAHKILYNKLTLLTENDMDRHGKLPLVLLQFEQADISDSQMVITGKFGPTSTKEPPVTNLTITNQHLGFPYLAHAMEHQSLVSVRKMQFSIS